MKKLNILATACLLTISAKASTPTYKYITIGTDAVEHNSSLLGLTNTAPSAEGISIVKVDTSKLNELSHHMHDEFKRCGGFVLHDSLEEAEKTLGAEGERSFAAQSLFSDYTIDQESTVKPLVASIQEANITSVINHLSTYRNRYYKSKTGVEAADWIFNKWKSIAVSRTDVSVEKFKHDGFPQPSVILTIAGASAETIVIGGHLDSIAGYWGKASAHAPGADDNASGIATITEVLRSIIESGYKPAKTIKFMGYAAEEVGLLGSSAIAKKMKKDGVDVIGALQLDMTNFKGSDLDIVMMTDYTNEAQNTFIGSLIDKYLPTVSWGYDKCGYACSDHASWTRQGYPASMPFESKKRDMNRKIHTKRDTIERSGGNAEHATKFAKMAVAFLVELDR